MITSGKYLVILVPSSSHAIRAENVLHKAGIESKLIPVPRTLSSDCGVCVRIAIDDRDAADKTLTEARVPVDRFAEL